MWQRTLSIIIPWILILNLASQSALYEVEQSSVNFISEAPLETIAAGSDALQGLLDLSSGSFGFKLSVVSFDGFNSPLQKEHFFENYIEGHLFPVATFSGKILDPLSNLTDQDLEFRTKGTFEIHGKNKEVLIPIFIRRQGREIIFSTQFELLLMDFGIRVPRIVRQKISQVIKVAVNGKLVPQ